MLSNNPKIFTSFLYYEFDIALTVTGQEDILLTGLSLIEIYN